MTRWSIPLACLLMGGLIGAFVAGPVLLGQPAVSTAIPKELTSYRDVVKNVLPAVVSIESKSKPKLKSKKKVAPLHPQNDDVPFTPTPPRGRQNDDSPTPPAPPQVPEEFRKFFEDFQRQPFDPDESPRQSFGSGFLVDPKGVILTNFHVVDGANQVEVTLKDGRKFVSTDIKTDPKTDLAIVRIHTQGAPLPYLELGDSDAMEIGDRVLAVGAPFGLTGSVTAGIISAKGRNLSLNMYEDFLQTDAAINPGNSGGPLVNLEGKVVAINSAIKSRTGGFQGVGMAIASNLAKNVMEQLLSSGRVHRGYLGVQIKNLDSDVAAELGLKSDQPGVLIGQVFDNTPAAKAGLKDGDVVTAIAGKPVKSGQDLQRVIAGLPLGKPVDVTVFRDGKSQVVSVTIEEQPSNFGVARNGLRRIPKREHEDIRLERIGIDVEDMTPEKAEELGYKENATGALITHVDPDGLAAEKGLARGMLIAKVDKQPVKSAAEFRDIVNKTSLDKGILLEVKSPQGGTDMKMLKPSAGVK